MKSHIHDPNAPELVHFLFSPLTLIVEASHESNGAPNLPARVVSPLLTYDAIELLSNCLSSKETELWHSLGDAWRTPKYAVLRTSFSVHTITICFVSVFIGISGTATSFHMCRLLWTDGLQMLRFSSTIRYDFIGFIPNPIYLVILIPHC